MVEQFFLSQFKFNK